MKYEAKVIPEGINTSKHNPIRELLLLGTASLAVIFVIILLLTFLTDYLVGFIPPEAESRWFDNSLINFESAETDQAEREIFRQGEQYLLSLVSELKQDEYQDFEFSVNIIDAEQPNAFIIPGGHIFISSALFNYIDSENGLAMVLSHEMAHQYRRHPLKAMGRGVIIGVALSALFGSDTGDWIQDLLFEAVNISQLAFSREQEREADSIAVQSLIKHYGHAQGATEFFIKIRTVKEFQNSIPTFYQSHPGTEERIEFIAQFENRQNGLKKGLPDFIMKFIQRSEASKD